MNITYPKLIEQANKFKEAFLSITEDDIKNATPLNIDGYKALLFGDYFGVIEVASESVFVKSRAMFIPALVPGNPAKTMRNIQSFILRFIPNEVPSLLIHETVHWMMNHNEQYDLDHSVMKNLLQSKAETEATLWEIIWAVNNIDGFTIELWQIANKLNNIWDEDDLALFLSHNNHKQFIENYCGVTIIM